MTLELRIDGGACVDGEPLRDETVEIELPVEIRSDGPVGLKIQGLDRTLRNRLLRD